MTTELIIPLSSRAIAIANTPKTRTRCAHNTDDEIAPATEPVAPATEPVAPATEPDVVLAVEETKTGGSDAEVLEVILRESQKSLPMETISPVVHLAIYSGVNVFEQLVNGVCVMRRVHDGYANATRILKAAGLSENQRRNVLTKEVNPTLLDIIQA